MNCPHCDFIVNDNTEVCPKCGGEMSVLKNFPSEKTFAPLDTAISGEENGSKPFTPPDLTQTMESIIQSLDELDQASLQGLPENVLRAEPSMQNDVRSIEKGGFWIRFLAFAIDKIVIYVISIALLIAGALGVGMNYSPFEGDFIERLGEVVTFPYVLILVIMTMIYYTYFIGTSGQTIGKMICRLKVVQTNGEPVSYGQAFLRWVGYLVSSIFFYLGFFWIVFDHNRQGWHDKIADTYVVRV